MVLLTGAEDRLRVSRALASGGYKAVIPLDVRSWVAARPEAVLVTDDEERSSAVRRAIVLAAPATATIILVHAPDPDKYRKLLATCTAVLPRSAPEPDVLCAVNAAWRALACLPVSVLRGLTGTDGNRPVLEARELAWLRRLAGGATVAGLARAAGYSEREMYRLLSATYGSLGADTRTESLLRADRWGLLADDGDAARTVPRGAPRSGAVA